MSAAATPHEDALAMALRRDALGGIGDVKAAADAYGAALRAFRTPNDIVAVMGHGVEVIFACERLAEAASVVARSAREALAKAMVEAGATGIATAHHTAHTQDSPRRTIIIDPASVPRDLWTTPESKPDASKVRAALQTGRSVPGAELGNGGPPILVIKCRKDTT